MISSFGICRRFGLGMALLAALLLSGSGVLVLAQEPQPEHVNRTGTLTAPERSPVTLEPVTPSSLTGQTVVELPAVADAYLASNRPNDNFGAGDGLFLGYSTGGLDFGAERVLLRFDLPDTIPATARLHDARVRLYLDFSNPSTDPPMGTVLRRLATPWNETGVTWNSEPTWGGIRASLNVGSARGWYEWEVTSLVAGWIKGNYPNHGVEIIGDERVQLRERAFFARETTTIFYPRLRIDYSLEPADEEPPQVSVDPLPAFTTARDFVVSWSGSDFGEDATGIDYYDVQFRVNNGPWVTWLEETTLTSALFTGAENGRRYEFRARGVDEAGNVEAFGAAEAETTVDYLPPTATVNPLPLVTNATSFGVAWQGTDGANEAGIYCYDVQYRYQAGPWLLWQDCTVATSAIFVAPFGDGSYQFEARATDNLGLSGSFLNQAESATIVDVTAPFVDVKQVYLPLIVQHAP